MENDNLFVKNDGSQYSENNGSVGTTIFGSPWSTDQEIYDYVIQKRYVEEWEWSDVKDSLMSQGLPEHYADAIIENTQSEGKKAKKSVRLRGIGEIAGAIIWFLIGFNIVFFDSERMLTTKGFIIWIVGTIALLIDGCYRLNRKF